MAKYLITFFLLITAIYLYFKEPAYNYNTITFGASLPKTGIMKEWGRNVEIGTKAYFKFANEKKLLPKQRKVNLVTLDDKYEPELTIENTKKLLQRENLFALYGYVGTPTVKNILPFLEDTNIPFIAPFTGASFLRKSNEFIVNFRSSYYEEIDKIVSYLKNIKKIKKISVFYQNDDYGEEGYVSLIKSLEKRGLSLYGEGMYKRNTLAIKHAFSQIKENEPEAIIMIGAYKANSIFIKKAREDEKLKNVILCNISFGDANDMIKELNEKETKNLIFSQVVPSYVDFKIDVIREYRYIMNRYYPKEHLGFISLESFLVAKAVVAALKEIKGDITHSKFLKNFKKLSKDTLKGIDLEYKNSQLLNKVYLFKYENSKFKEIEYD